MKDKKISIISAIMIFLLLLLVIYGFSVDMSHRFGANLSYGLAMDGIVLIIWILVLMRFFGNLNLNLEVYSLVLIGMLFHIAGDLYLFGKTLGPIEYDMFVHFFFGFVISLIVYRFLTSGRFFEDHKFGLFLFVILGTVGLSGLHEILEFFGYFFLGEGSGIFMYGVGDFGEYHDIAWDLISGFIGSLVGFWYSKLRFE